MEENILSDQELKQNIQTQKTGEGQFVTTDTAGDYSMFGPPKGAIKKVTKTFERDFIPGSSSVVAREIVTDLSKVKNLPNIEDVMATDNPEFQSEIENYYGFKDKTGQVIPMSEKLTAKERLRIMNLGGATHFMVKRPDHTDEKPSLEPIKIPYDAGIAKKIKEPEGYLPPSAQAILLKSTSIEKALDPTFDAKAFDILPKRKEQGRFPSMLPFIGGKKIGVTLDNAFGTNFDEVGGQVALAKAYNKILIEAGLNERQRYGILKERLNNKFKDLFNIIGYTRRGVRYGIEAPVYILGETYDLLTEGIKKSTTVDIAKLTGTENFKDSVSRTNFYDMIIPLQANIIQDGFAAQNIEIDLGTSEMLASMFTSTPFRLAALVGELGVPSSAAAKITSLFGKRELSKYRAYRAKKLFRMGPSDLPSKDPDFDRKLIEEYTEFRAKSMPLFNRVQVGDTPLLGKVYTKINSLRTGPAIVHGLQIEEAGKELSENAAVKSKLSIVENLQKQRTDLIDSKKGSYDIKFSKRLELLNKQIDMANNDLRYEISTANVPQFIKDVAKGNKAMIIGSATFGQLAQESGVDVPLMEMVGLGVGISFAVASNLRNMQGKIATIGGIIGTKKGTKAYTEELAKKVNTFSPEFAEVLGQRIRYIDDLSAKLKNVGVDDELLGTSFATMSNLAILQTLEETARISISQKDVGKFGQVIEDFQKIHDEKQKLLNQLRLVTLRIADFKKTGLGGESITELDKFEKTVQVAYDYAQKRTQLLGEDIDLLQRADLAKIESLIKGTVGKLEDHPMDKEDISSALTRVYKLGFSPTKLPTLDEIKNHNESTFNVVSKAFEDKSKSLRTEQLLKKGQKLVSESDDVPDYKNSDDLFLGFGENVRNFENAKVSGFYQRLDKATFVTADGVAVEGSAKVEGMDILEGFIQAVPKNETEIFKQIGGGTIGTSKQSQIFRGFSQAADSTLQRMFEKLPAEQMFDPKTNPKGYKTVDDFIASILAASPNIQEFDFLPKNLQAVYAIYKNGGMNNVKIDSLPLGFDQLKELKTSFSRLQNMTYKPNDTVVSDKYRQLKQIATRKFQEFEVNFGEENSRLVGNLFVLDAKGNNIPVSRILADGDAAHQVYMNRYFDNKTNFNYFFKGRDKTVKTNLNPTGITLAQKPSFTENVEKISKMGANELEDFREDLLKRFGSFEDLTPPGLPQDVERQGRFFINKNSPNGKTLTAILELKLSEYIADAAREGKLNTQEYARKLLKFEEAYTVVNSKGEKVSLINARKVEKDLFSYSPASIGENLFNEGENRLRTTLEKVSKKNFTTLNDTLIDYRQIERSLRSVLPEELGDKTLIEVATVNPQKFKQIKQGLLQTFGNKYDQKSLDTLITGAFMEDLTKKVFKRTGKMSVMGSGESLVAEVDMDMDQLKQIIGFNDKQRNNMVKEIIGEDRMDTLNSMVKWMAEQYDIEKVRANVTGIPRNFSVESYISRFYSINRGVISARYVGTEAVLQQFRLSGHKLFQAIIEDKEVGKLFMEIIKTGQPLSRQKEIQFFNALVSSLNKYKTWETQTNPEQNVVINDNYKAKYKEYDRENQTIDPLE